MLGRRIAASMCRYFCISISQFLDVTIYRYHDLLIDGAKIRRFFYSHNTFSMLFTYHIYGILS